MYNYFVAYNASTLINSPMVHLMSVTYFQRPASKVIGFLFASLASSAVFSANNAQVERALVYFTNASGGYECTGIRQSGTTILFKGNQCNPRPDDTSFVGNSRSGNTTIASLGQIKNVPIGSEQYSSANVTSTNNMFNQPYLIPLDDSCSNGTVNATLFYFNSTNTSNVMSSSVSVSCRAGESVCNFTLPTGNMPLKGEPLMTAAEDRFSLLCLESDTDEDEKESFQCVRVVKGNCPTSTPSSSAGHTALNLVGLLFTLTTTLYLLL